MTDRSLTQLSSALLSMQTTGSLPLRHGNEPLRQYFRRVVPAWLDVHGATHPVLATRVQHLYDRELRRHPAPTSEAASNHMPDGDSRHQDPTET